MRFIVGVPVIVLMAFAIAMIARSWYAAEQWFVVPDRSIPTPPVEWEKLRNVSFQAADGTVLQGWFLPPKRGATIVLAHGFGQGRGGLLPEARFLAAADFGLLLYDSRGHGTSEGGLTLGFKEQLDLAAALAFARAQPEVDPSRVGSLGFSMGAVALAHVAASDPALRAIVLLSPYPSLEKILSLSFGSKGPLGTFGATLAARRHGIDLDAVRAEQVLPKLEDRTFLVIVGAMEHGQNLMDEVESLLPPGGTMWRVAEGGHGGFIEVEPRRYPETITRYFTELLTPDSRQPLSRDR